MVSKIHFRKKSYFRQKSISDGLTRCYRYVMCEGEHTTLRTVDNTPFRLSHTSRSIRLKPYWPSVMGHILFLQVFQRFPVPSIQAASGCRLKYFIHQVCKTSENTFS